MPPVLWMLTANDKFRLEINTAARGALFEFEHWQWELIGYHSKKLPQAVQNNGIRELELNILVCNILGIS